MKQLLSLFSTLIGFMAVSGQVKEMHPFTGAMTVENGIRYDKLEITLDGYLLLTPDIPQNEELLIKITKPWSLQPDAAGKIHPGVGFRITDNT